MIVTVTCGRAGGQARDAVGQAVEHRHGGGLGHCRGLLQHRRRQRGERGGVGRGVQLCANLRRPAVVDRRSGAKHQHRSDQRIHHRDIAAATAQQPIKTECRHGKAHSCRGLAPLDEIARAPRVKTSVIKQRAGLCPSNGFRTICRNAKDFVRRDPAFSAFRYVRSWVRPTAHDGEPRRVILAIPRGPLPRANPRDFVAFHECEDHRATAMDRPARVCQSR